MMVKKVWAVALLAVLLSGCSTLRGSRLLAPALAAKARLARPMANGYCSRA